MEAGASQHFSLAKELSLSSDIKIASWCPTMDLCAVVSTDGQLHLHRMDWQQLWAISPESLITAVCWRPDGKELAAGHANGVISILDVETGEIITGHKVHYAGIATISWADSADNSSASLSSSTQDIFGPQHSLAPHQRYKRLFAPPILDPRPPSNSTEPLPNPYDFSLEAVGAPAWPQDRDGVSLMTAADVRGVVSIWLQGQVQIAEVAGGSISSSIYRSRSSTHDDNTQEPQQEEEHEQYKLIHVVPSSRLEQLLTVHVASSGSVLVVSHTLQLLKQQQQPLLQCTALFSQLQSFLHAAVKCVEVCHQDWSSVMKDFAKRFDTQLKQELADQGSTITVPQQELLLLLATSSPTPPLQSFLASTLGEAGLRRMARAIDTTTSGLHTALLERVMPLVELILFLLTELRGLVACGSEGGDLDGQWMGLQIELLHQLELNAAALLLRTEQLRRTVTASACQYRAFFTWLLKAIKQLEGQDSNSNDNDGSNSSGSSLSLPMCQNVLAFLKGQFMHDDIGAELSGAPLNPEAQSRAEALFYQGITPAETHQLLALMLPNPKALNPVFQSFTKPLGSEPSVIYPYSLPNSPVTAALRDETRQQLLPGQQQQQPEKGAALSQDLVDKTAVACSRGLAQQLKHLTSLCDEAFEQPLSVISPTITPVAQLLLLPPAATAASSSSNSVLVHIGQPLLQPKGCVDQHMYVCCQVPPAAAAGIDQRQQLLLVRVPPKSFQSIAQQQQQRNDLTPALCAEALLLKLPAGKSAAACAFYQQQQLALLLQDSGGPGGAVLQLLQLEDAPWIRLQPQQQGANTSSSVLEQCIQRQEAVVQTSDLPCRSRQLQHGATNQLSVSRSRGLACVVTDMQHLLLLDLEEDEDQEVEDDEDVDLSE